MTGAATHLRKRTNPSSQDDDDLTQRRRCGAPPSQLRVAIRARALPHLSHQIPHQRRYAVSPPRPSQSLARDGVPDAAACGPPPHENPQLNTPQTDYDPAELLGCANAAGVEEYIRRIVAVATKTRTPTFLLCQRSAPDMVLSELASHVYISLLRCRSGAASSLLLPLSMAAALLLLSIHLQPLGEQLRSMVFGGRSMDIRHHLASTLR